MTRTNIPNDEIWSWGGNNDKPDRNRFEKGNESGQKASPPKDTDHNFQMNRSDKNVQYILRHGLLPWDNAETYSMGAVVLRTSSIYECLKSSVNNDPVTSSEYWKLLKLEPANHTHNASDINSGTLSNDRLNKASTSQQGIVQTSTSLTSTRSDLAASAFTAKTLNEKIKSYLSESYKSFK